MSWLWKSLTLPFWIGMALWYAFVILLTRDRDFYVSILLAFIGQNAIVILAHWVVDQRSVRKDRFENKTDSD
jgi:hypothetical protein